MGAYDVKYCPICATASWPPVPADPKAPSKWQCPGCNEQLVLAQCPKCNAVVAVAPSVKALGFLQCSECQQVSRASGVGGGSGCLLVTCMSLIGAASAVVGAFALGG